MQYRREIDGLRAVAVLPVILFHAGIGAFSGGYVGVDIFFVISGYLITSIILTERSEGAFTIWGFYERRARRILPALFLVVIASLPFAWAWMPPEMLEDFGRSVAATTLFVSNVHFWETADYFASDTDMKPLLHTWSLAVEEQFYLIFPLLLMLIGTSHKRRGTWLLSLLALLSLLLCEWGWRHEPEANFYFTLSRFWELLVGSLCAILLFARRPYASNGLAALGLALILFAILGFDESLPFPSLYTVVPVLGTALIILFAGQETATTRLLSCKFLVGIGLISYSAYLWHQPIFAFIRIRSPQEPTLALMLVASVVVLGFAYLSWRFVEQPFRRRHLSLLPSRRAIFSASAVGMALLVGFGTFVERSGGAPFRIAPNGVKYSDLLLDLKLAPNYGLNPACTVDLGSALASPECRTNDNPSVLLWGDSHAMHLGLWLAESDSADEIGLQQITKSQCWPILNISPSQLSTPQGQDCITFNDDVLEWISTQEDISTVVMSSPFNTTRVVRNRAGNLVENSDDTFALDQLLGTINTLRSLGKRVVVISSPPNKGNDLGMCLLTSSLWGKHLSTCDFTTREFSSWIVRAYRLLQRAEASVPVVFLDQLMCSNGLCSTSDDAIFLYRDTDHLSVEGAISLGKKIDLLELVLSKAGFTN